MHFLCSFFTLIARLCLAAVFVFSGIGKFIFFDVTAEALANKGFMAASILLFAAAFIELIAALSLIIGYRARVGAFILLLYLIPVTFLFHNFWDLDGGERVLQQIMFLKNLAIFGGLLYVVCHGPGSCSFDHCGCCKKSCSATPPSETDHSEQK